jgi:predicted TIM-barrel fold metal-dependent hydrolase
VQPGHHLYDHSYVTSVLRRYPNTFVGCALANPTLPPAEAAAEIERLARQDGYRALRLNPALWPEGRRMNDEVFPLSPSPRHCGVFLWAFSD